MSERVQKIIAAAGLMSRRAAEEAIAAGRVSVNGRTVTLAQPPVHFGCYEPPEAEQSTPLGNETQKVFEEFGL